MPFRNPNQVDSILSRGRESLLSTHVVLRNTYMLLGLTLIFSGITAAFAMVTGATMPSGISGALFFFVGAYGLLFLTQSLRNSAWGLLSIFAFTGFMGYTLGPLLNAVMQMSNGSDIIMTSLGGTGLTFVGLSAYALTTKKDFSFLTGFVVAGCIVAMVAIIAGIFIHAPAFHLAISAGIMLLSCALILWHTSAIIHGGERNYIMATIGLYLQIYNLFVSLLHILSALNNRD